MWHIRDSSVVFFWGFRVFFPYSNFSFHIIKFCCGFNFTFITVRHLLNTFCLGCESNKLTVSATFLYRLRSGTNADPGGCFVWRVWFYVACSPRPRSMDGCPRFPCVCTYQAVWNLRNCYWNKLILWILQGEIDSSLWKRSFVIIYLCLKVLLKTSNYLVKWWYPSQQSRHFTIW